MSTPVVAIVGHPNAGKSTLFNRLVGHRKAIVDKTPGVTRDRNTHMIVVRERAVYLIDTGGFEPVARDNLKAQVMEQTLLAIEEADVILLVCDGRVGLNAADEEVAQVLRSAGKKTILVVNKIDAIGHEKFVGDFFSLGLQDPLAISAEHNRGLEDLRDHIHTLLPAGETRNASSEKACTRIAIIGKPNTGKSSLVNQILGTDRIIVSEQAGTTRDSIDTLVRVHDREYLLIDTAGIRKKSRVSQKLEKYSVLMALKNVERSDLVVLMIDAASGIGAQDVKIASHACDAGRACIVAVNKWDLLEKKTRTFMDFERALRDKFTFLSFAPVLSLSALTGQRVARLFPLIDRVYKNYGTRIQTSEITRIFESALRRHPPPQVRGKIIRMFFATQAGVCPPTFVCFVNNPAEIPPSYVRYLENNLRETYPFEGCPIRIFLKMRTRKE